ncbi:DUF3592 domain-containing protein [Hoyosella sp. G463]|uniref:DUF3592 domain-containing protein n=2 Tax=Lolliginicoccus lacisalsi TaxID=2742202 RepID=A0A927JE35_9ACTN|nr:DUF3592 domain-containing protein [Lolliginicoccus lacisalsi]
MRYRMLRRARRAVLLLAGGITLLAAILVVGAWRNDMIIESDMGVATAEVLSAGVRRSAVIFSTPDGVLHNPRLGVLYPTDLVVGQRIEVEYARTDPDLVRVAGRDARVAVVPALSIAIIAWLIAAPPLWYIRRELQRSEQLGHEGRRGAETFN